MLSSWQLLSSLILGSLVAGAVLASTVIYADLIRDLGLRHALEQAAPESLDLRISQRNIAVRGQLYVDSRARIDDAAADSLGTAAGAVVREGTSATFYPTLPGALPDLGDDGRPRANLRFLTDLGGHIKLDAGRLPAAVEFDRQRPLEVLLGSETASRNAIFVGDRLTLHPFWDEEIAPLQVEIVGLIAARDLDERYWGGVRDPIDAQSTRSETLLFIVSQDTFFGAVPVLIPSTTASYVDSYQVDSSELTARNADTVAARVSLLESRLSATEAGTEVTTELVAVLRTFDDRLFFVRIPLFVLLLQVGGIVAYFLLVVSTMVVERQALEISMLRSRGASTSQILTQYGVEAGVIAGIGVLLGPLLAAFVISSLGSTPTFADLSGGEPLGARISTMAFVLAAVGGLLTFLAFMLPAWRATTRTVVSLKREDARPRRTPLFLRLHLDLVLVGLLGLILWRLRQDGDLFDQPLFGDRQMDPVLLATPAVATLAVGVVFLRVFPLVLRVIAFLVAATRATVLLVGTQALARNPIHYSRLILMLMLATSVGMFGATFSATLDRSYSDRTLYEVGADVRADDLRGLAGQSDAAFLRAVETVPAEVMSPVIRVVGSVTANGREERIELLGVEPESFGDVAYFREDFAEQSLEEMLIVLSANAAATDYSLLPDDARQLGVWLKFPDIRGAFDVLATLRDREGQLRTAFLGNVRPSDTDRGEWRFFAMDLERPRRADGQLLPVELAPPLILQSLVVRTNSQIGAQRGVVLFGPVLSSRLPPAGPPADGPPAPARQAFAGASTVYEFTAPRFEPVHGVVARALDDVIRVDTDAPPGFETSARYEWIDSGRSPLTRGLQQQTDGQPTHFYLTRTTAERLGLEKGDAATLSVRGAHLRGVFMGDFSLFPTYDANSSVPGLAIVNATRLSVDANAAFPDSQLGYNSAWFDSADPVRTREMLTSLRPQQLDDIVNERMRQERDPLIAAGWSGILAISFGAVLFLAAIAFIVYSYLTAQRRRLEFAILRTLGFSRFQVFGVVLLEHLFVIVIGMGLGTVVGIQVGRLMMDFFAVDEGGASVLPPFVLSVSRVEVGLAWGILGAVFVLSIAAVVTLYGRLALHRALRVGDA